MSRYSEAQRAALNAVSPRLTAAGLNLSDELEAVWTEIQSASLGADATADEIDAVCEAAAFAVDPDTTTGLTLGYAAGAVIYGGTRHAISAGTILLASSSTNYVEVDYNGGSPQVVTNASGFTAGRVRLLVAVTGVSGITSVTSARDLLVWVGQANTVPGTALTTASVAGAALTTAGATKEISAILGDISATSTFTVIVPDVAGSVAKIAFATKTAIATNDTNYWTFGVVNKGPSGSGTQTVADAAAAANSTKTTGGSAITGYVKRNLTLDSVSAAAGDVLEITITKAASATTMQQCAVRIDVTFSA
jgi:hypothetical protein